VTGWPTGNRPSVQGHRIETCDSTFAFDDIEAQRFGSSRCHAGQLRAGRGVDNLFDAVDQRTAPLQNTPNGAQHRHRSRTPSEQSSLNGGAHHRPASFRLRIILNGVGFPAFVFSPTVAALFDITWQLGVRHKVTVTDLLLTFNLHYLLFSSR